MTDTEWAIKGLGLLLDGCDDIQCEDCGFNIKEPATPRMCGLNEEQIQRTALKQLLEQQNAIRSAKWMDELIKEIIVPYDSMPQLHTELFLTKEQAEQFKDVFKNIVAVIRCRDCKHKEESVSPSWEAWCNRLHCGCDLDWFCADGERRTDNA